MYEIIILACIILVLLFMIMTTESMVDDRTFNLLMDLPYTKPVKITGKNPNEYFGYGYLTPDAGMQAAMGNTVRVLGQEFTNPRQGVQDDEIIQNRYRNKWGNIK